MSNIIIGKLTNINGKYNINCSEKAKVIIGKFCAIANNFRVITLNHDYNYTAVQGKFYDIYFNSKHPGEINKTPNRERTKGDVIIGNDVWIGEDVFILSGVKIGDGCCIGARSVVTRDLPPYSICVGQPCKKVKNRYNDDIIEFLLELKWWDWDDNKIKKNKSFFITNLNNISLNELKTIIN